MALLSEPASTAPPRVATPAAQRAELLLWLAFAFFLLGVGIGTGWDRRWHASHPFEDFWSPPHLFIYTNTLVAAAIVVYVTFNDRLRGAFDLGKQRLPLLSFAVPRALLLLGAGFLIIGLGGALDAVWHTAFGLDETNWSLPHAMLGHGILLAALGFASAQLALPRRLPWWAAGLLAWVILNTALDLIGGPILRNPPPDALRRIAELPVLAVDPAYQHTSRIYLAWHLDRTNWLFLPMVAFSVGFGLRLAQRLTGPLDRWLVAVSAVGIALTLLAADNGPVWARVLLAPPFLPAALGYALARRLGSNSTLAWCAAGWAACAISLIWVRDPLPGLIFGPLAVGGAWLAARILGVVNAPSRRAATVTAASIGVMLPVVTGAVDLYWRSHTP